MLLLMFASCRGHSGRLQGIESSCVELLAGEFYSFIKEDKELKLTRCIVVFFLNVPQPFLQINNKGQFHNPLTQLPVNKCDHRTRETGSQDAKEKNIRIVRSIGDY